MAIVTELKPGMMMPNRIFNKQLVDEEAECSLTPLAFLTYETVPGSGKMRHGVEYANWEEKSAVEKPPFDNVPTSGFQLRNCVGGVQESYTHFAKKAYVEIIDPRGFMVQILVENLIFLLQYCKCSPPGIIEGELAYAWDNGSLRLLPVNEPSIQALIQEIVDHTSHRTTNTFVSPKDFKLGHVYRRKKDNATMIYLGRVDYYECSEKPKKKHLFIDDKIYKAFLAGTRKISFDAYTNLKGVFSVETSIKLSEEEVNNIIYAFEGTKNCSPVDPKLGEKHYFTPDQFVAFLSKSCHKSCSVMSEKMPQNNIWVYRDSSGLYKVRLAAQYKEIHWSRELVETFAQKEDGSELFSAEECVDLLKPYYYEAFLQNGRLCGYRCKDKESITEDVNLFVQ